ncbi:MAG: phosphate regulon sensor histidine kinase PhoR, partial [Gammaproteobacteria bacterium]
PDTVMFSSLHSAFPRAFGNGEQCCHTLILIPAMMNTETPGHQKEELAIFLGVLLASAAAGMLTGWLLPCLLLGLSAYLGWHIYQLARLPRLLREPAQSGLTPAAGLWKAVHAELQNLHTDCHQREHILSHSAERFRRAITALPDAVVMVDRHETIEWFNPAAGSLLGINTGDKPEQIFSARVNDPVLDEYLATGKFTEPLVFSAPGNRTIILSMYVVPLDNEQKMIVASDISRQYHLDVMKRDFAANISHELRTPLTVISGLLEQIEAGDMGEVDQDRAIVLMQQQATRMRELVSDLLALTRLESRPQSSIDEYVPVPELLADIAAEARSLSGSAGHTVQLDIQSPDGLHGNRKELRTAFSNLVVNAVQHTPKRAEVRIRWMVDSTGAHLSVTDTGEGIAARHIPRLTERLYRVDASRSRASGGTGLGLAIVRHVLDHHNAELEINSEPGRGSTFTCNFPGARVSSPEADRGVSATD